MKKSRENIPRSSHCVLFQEAPAAEHPCWVRESGVCPWLPFQKSPHTKTRMPIDLSPNNPNGVFTFYGLN